MDADFERDVFIQSLYAYLAKRYQGSLGMEDLARHFNVSVRTLQNHCHLTFEESPSRVVRRYRLRQLHQAILEQPFKPLVHLYAACGLSGMKADQRLFTEMYGCSIRQHRLARQSQSVPSP